MKRRIVCAANRYGEVVVCGARHWDSVMSEVIGRLRGHGLCQRAQEEQGFIDQKGLFLSREEAWMVAEAAGQIARRVGGDTINGGRLFSENLY